MTYTTTTRPILNPHFSPKTVSKDISSLSDITANNVAADVSHPVFKKPVMPLTDLTPSTLLDFHLRHNPHYPVGVLVDIHDEHPNEFLRWTEVGNAIHNFYQTIESSISCPKETIFGIITSGDPLSYLVVLLSLIKLNHIVRLSSFLSTHMFGHAQYQAYVYSSL